MKSRRNLSFFLKTGVFLTVLFISNVLQPIRVSGYSMEPTLSDGDILIASIDVVPEKIDYGTIIVYRLPDNESDVDGVVSNDRFFIKRVVGKPGDVIYIVDGGLVRNGIPIDEPEFDRMEDAGIAANTVILGEGEYFCLGDNRNESGDSRKIGPVSITDITHIINNR